MDEKLKLELMENRDKIMDFLTSKINGQPAYESTLAEIASKEIILGTGIASFITANPELIPTLPDMVGAVVRKTLNIRPPEDPLRKSNESSYLESPHFSTSDELTDMCNDLNNLKIDNLNDRINHLIKEPNWRTKDGIFKEIGSLIIEEYTDTEKSLTPFYLKTESGNLAKSQFYYSQGDGQKLTVCLNNKEKTSYIEINYLFELDSLPVIADTLFRAKTRVENVLRKYKLERQHEAVNHLYGKDPAFILFVPNDFANEENLSRPLKLQLDRYSELNGHIVYACLPYAEINEKLSLEQKARIYKALRA